ncbi:hypothetical protein NF27_FP00070 [Candidatus Jidaibacter acanthamoeba]|uniref:Uncharacterized protein n=1 Tax=Candidatus Jidaibacter acanthamoebae TaxID=86105 RepID=A0A0C1MY01_9RICK|nr:hypothetical protein [Candidatus Jidaibacter acanthamoeba]KIE04816.1 hypothetical protein NF27_FP00070 [Candidatus Jidaibacter acanthamoeba]
MQSIESNKYNSLTTKINTYKPGALDFFGYDISGKRKKLIKDLIESLKEIREEDLTHYLESLKKSLHQRRIDQDISLGVFLNVLKEKDYDFNEVDKSIKSLLKAGERPYHDVKLNFELSREEQQIIKNILEKMKSSSSVKIAIEEVINDWLKRNMFNLNKLQPQNKLGYEQKVLRILKDISQVINPEAKQDYTTIPEKFSLNREVTPDVEGELIEVICLYVANNATLNQPEDFTKERAKLIESLPTNLKKLHTEYSRQSILQVNSLRLLKVFQKTKTIEKLSSSLLEIFQDESLYSTFKKHIAEITTIEHGKLKWKNELTKELLESNEFQNLIQASIAGAHLEAKEYPKLLKKIETFSYKPKSLDVPESLATKNATGRGI